MSLVHQPTKLTSYDFGTSRLDLSQLVGFQMKVFSEQFPGKELRTRVVAASDQRLSAESSQRHEAIDNLVNYQQVILQFRYRGEEITVKARLKKTGGGHCNFELEGAATPLSRRRFCRVNITSKVNLAPLPSAVSLGRRLNRLRWMETSAANFSAGGTLVAVPTMLHDSVRLLINIQPTQFMFPQLLLAKVCHSYRFDEVNCRAGIEFVTREQAGRMFSAFQMREMPPTLFTYTNDSREMLNRAVQRWDSKINSESNTGVDHEGK